MTRSKRWHYKRPGAKEAEQMLFDEPVTMAAAKQRLNMKNRNGTPLVGLEVWCGEK